MNKLILLLMMIPGLAFGQRIWEDKIDKFSNKRKIETTFVPLTDSGLLGVDGGTLKAAIHQENGLNYLVFLYYTKNPTFISEGDKVFLLDEDSNKYMFEVVSNYDSIINKQPLTDLIYHTLQFRALGDLSVLENKKFTDLRLVRNDKYVDFLFKEKFQINLSKLYKVFADNLHKK